MAVAKVENSNASWRCRVSIIFERRSWRRIRDVAAERFGSLVIVTIDHEGGEQQRDSRRRTSENAIITSE